MVKNLVKVIVLLWSFILFSSCSSVEKYNAQIAKKHTPSELKEDVDFAYKKLKRLHPELYRYISKEKLDANFESLKKNITKPLSSIEFYKIISPVIASIGQGHTSISSPHKKQTKAEIKSKGKRKWFFKNYHFTTINDKVLIDKGYGKDSLIEKGTELLKIDNEPVEKLIASYQNKGTGDGYVKGFMPEFTRKAIGRFYYFSNTLKDSLKFTLKNKDSIYTKYLYAFSKKDKKNKADKTKKDSVKSVNKVLTKAERKLKKKKKKARSDWEWDHGYDKFTKESMRNFEFLETDSEKVAYMKIRGFHKWDYEDFYDDVFTKIDSAKVGNLVIDLRDNTGGRLSEIEYIYSYLADKEYQFIKPGKMTRPNSWMYPMVHNKASVLQKSIVYLLYPALKVVQALKVRKINGEPHFHYKTSKLRKPKLEHNYKGKVYVLINAVSFSASAVLSNKLKATKRAFFVGDETGGAYNTTVAGRFANVILPNSQNVMRVGVMVLETPHKTTPDGYGVKPDKYIPTITLDKDEQLDWVLKDISK